MKKVKRDQKIVGMKQDVHKKLKEIADKRGVTMSQTIRDALAAYDRGEWK